MRYVDIWDKNALGAQFHTSVTNMSSSEEDVLVAYWFRRRMRRKRKYCVHPYNLTNVHHSSTVVSRELSQHKSKFREFYPMNSENFHFIKSLVTRIVPHALMNFH